MIDIIIVNFNAAEHLTNCVLSVLNTSLPIRIFISDNGSTDDSLLLLEKNIPNDSPVFIQKNKKNLGFSKGNNVLFQKTTADYLLFLNPDCILKPNTLEQLLCEFHERTRVGMISCLIRNVDGTEQAGCRRNIPTPISIVGSWLRLNQWFSKSSLFSNFNHVGKQIPHEPVVVEGISGAFMLVKRQAIEEVGLLDENYFLHCEDLDWCMRFRALNWQILFVPTVEIIHVKGVCSKTKPIQVLWHKHHGMIRFYEKFFRKQYGRILSWGVYLGIWLRFCVMVVELFVVASIRRMRSNLVRT